MATRRIKRRQDGAALLIFVLLLVMGALGFVLNNLSPELMRARKTGDALAEAREALLGYALRYRETQIATGNLDQVYGFLPLPDLGSSRNNNTGCVLEGCDAANFSGNAANVTVIGRLPWRTLGTVPLRDSHGECLWYAVSGSHQRMQQTAPMNWDTLGQFDVVVADGTTALASALTSPLTAHDRPVAIIFSPGPPLPGQNRGVLPTGDDVTECGGNYAAANYLDPGSTALGTTSNYFSAATNQASGDTGSAIKAFSHQGTIHRDAANGKLWTKVCPPGSNCAIAANDVGLTVTGDAVFGAIRKSSSFRLDINSMLDRMVGCLRDLGVSASAHPLASNACYDDTKDPRGYFSHYQEQLFAAKCSGNCTATIDGTSPTDCPSVLLFAGQRQAGQLRGTTAEKAAASNYLETPNLASFTGGGNTFSGQSQLARVSTAQPAHQDIVRCIPAGASFTSVESTALSASDQLTAYDSATRTLTLGKAGIVAADSLDPIATALFGCAWSPEARTTGTGLRSYFNFNILDSGDGFVFAAADGDRNGTGVCGAGQQHLGYSGNNGYTAPISYPKLGLEFDTRRNYQTNIAFTPTGFNPARLLSDLSAFRTLANGRADPSYTGGHIGIVYWGGESAVSTSDGITNTCAVNADCLSPSFCDTDFFCKLNPEEDDNVHGQLPVAPATRPPPRNEAAPVTPPSPAPYPPYAVDKLDPSLSSVPTNQVIHVRVEVERSAYAGRDDNSRLVRAVTNVNLPSLAGLTTLYFLREGATVPVVELTPAEGDTILVAGQTDARTNGVYVASTGAWTRATSADEGADLPPGISWFIKEGTVNKGSLWRLQNIEAPVVGISELTVQRFRDPVRAVSASNLALTALQTVDGVALAAGDRVLLTAQTDAKQNGVYTASAGAWSRAALESTTAGMKAGAMWFVTAGGQAGTYWWLGSDATPGTSDIAIALQTSNDIYSAILTTQVWKLADSVTVANQIARMKITSRSMNQLDPVVRYAQCLVGNTCPASNPDGQSCGGVETDGFRYCYTGQKPNLYDSKTVFDIRTTVSCAANATCSGSQQFCGIDNFCYQPAFRTTRLGFTDSQSTSDQVIEIKDFFTTWLP